MEPTMSPARTPQDYARRAELADAAAGIYPDGMEYPRPPVKEEHNALPHPDVTP